jgi:hypothetical protein
MWKFKKVTVCVCFFEGVGTLLNQNLIIIYLKSMKLPVDTYSHIPIKIVCSHG